MRPFFDTIILPIKNYCIYKEGYRVKEEYKYDVGKVLAYLVKQLNNRYDFRGVFYLGILKLISKILKSVKYTANKWQKDNDYFCSELCYEAFNFSGIDIVPEVSGADVASPGDIAGSAVLERR